MKFEDICNKIISEGKTKKTQKTVDGEKNKPEVITEIEDEKTVETPETVENTAEEKPVAELDNIERTFIEKFIEFTELNLVNKSYKTIVSDFKSVLGKNNKAVIEFLNQRKEEHVSKITALKEELKQLKEQIKTEEEDKANAAERKLNIVNLLSKASKKTDEKSEK